MQQFLTACTNFCAVHSLWGKTAALELHWAALQQGSAILLNVVSLTAVSHSGKPDGSWSPLGAGMLNGQSTWGMENQKAAREEKEAGKFFFKFTLQWQCLGGMWEPQFAWRQKLNLNNWSEAIFHFNSCTVLEFFCHILQLLHFSAIQECSYLNECFLLPISDRKAKEEGGVMPHIPFSFCSSLEWAESTPGFLLFWGHACRTCSGWRNYFL